MPRAAKHLALARQWQMLNLIPTRAPGISAREVTDRLADEGFAVSKRTVERDLVELSRQFGLGTHSPTGKPPFGWYFASGKRPDLGSVELVDAVSLVLAGDVLEQMLPASLLEAVSGKITQARAKLKSLKGHPMASWSEKVRFVPSNLAFQPPRIRHKVMEVVQQGLVEERQLEVRYAAFKERPKDLTLNPLSLVLRGPVPYLVATVHEYQDVLLFAVHRMERAQLGDGKAVVPAGYSVDDYISGGGFEFGSRDSMKLRAVVSEALAIYLSETPMSPDQKISFKQDRYELTATVRDTWQLQFWILSQGSGVTVVSPKRLRDRIHEHLLAAVGNYQ
jgi:predicted DNA-binding transcriptional regulator YafY